MMDVFATLSGNIGIGLATAFSPANLLYCFIGVFAGMLVGVLPGIGAVAAMSMLFPLTLSLPPTSALILLAGIWYGTAYGGSTAAILLNVPGSTSSAVACLDGYPMAKQGRAGIALMMTTVGSFFGGSVGILLMMLFSPLIVGYALEFTSAEYFALMTLGLVAASTVAGESVVKSLAMVVLGIMFGTVGIDVYTGGERFTFGQASLYDGISIAALAMGLFGVSEVITSIRAVHAAEMRGKAITLRSMIPGRDDVKRSIAPMVRGTAIGSFFGALPGTGPAIAAFLSYAVEKRVAREPERFGKGAIEGVVAPETANNAADQTAFIPTMTLGIPGSATMAIMLGALMIQGITPGPKLMTEHPDIFWGLVMSFWIGNVILVVLNIPLIGLWVRILTVPYQLLYPAILMFVCIGVYTVNTNTFDVWMVVLFGVLGYATRIADLPAAPVLLGFVLGPMMEEHFRRAMLVADGDFLALFHRPVSGVVLGLTLAILVWSLWSTVRLRRVRPAAM
jgi:TctA family transporter